MASFAFDSNQFSCANGDIGFFLSDTLNINQIDSISLTNNVIPLSAHIPSSYKALMFFTGGATNIENTNIFIENNVGGILDRSSYSLVYPEIP